MTRPTAALLSLAIATAATASDGPYARWTRGPSSDPATFPIAVWLQNPMNAAAWKQAGVNLYIGLHPTTTEEALTALRAAGMPVICEQNAVGLAHLDDPTIVGWMHGDEPDNAQSDGMGGYGPPILPSVIVAGAERIRAADPTRPVYLNLGQSVSCTDWIGRGTRTNHPEDYRDYLVGCDIASFDIYPFGSGDAPVHGNLWFVPQGVANLRAWSDDAKPVWCWIEAAPTPDVKLTPALMRAEAWMAIIAGARGIGWFCHRWAPSFDDATPLHDPALLAGITAIDGRITALAPAINAPTVADGVAVASSDAAVPVASLVKRWAGDTYVFAAASRRGSTVATVTIVGAGDAAVEVLDEDRTLRLGHGAFSDAFADQAVHLYRIVGVGGGDGQHGAKRAEPAKPAGKR